MSAEVSTDGALSAEINSAEPVELIKNNKCNRYYYRHREEILAKKRERRLADPEYQAKQRAKEDARRMKVEERTKRKEETRLEKIKKKAEFLGILPPISSGRE